MAKKVEIRLLDNPTNGQYVSYRIDIPSKFWSSTLLTVYRFSSIVLAGRIKIESNVANTITSMYNFMVDKYATFEWISVSEVVGGVDIIFNVDDFTESDIEISGDITINFVDIPTVAPVIGIDIVLARSPFNIRIEPTLFFDSAVLNLKIYRGQMIVDAPAIDTYTLSKSVVQAGQTKINFEVHKLIGDFVKANIPTFSVNGVTTSSINESVWVDVEIIAYYLDEVIGSANQRLYVIDGFGYHTELFNPTLKSPVLSTITKHIIFRNSDYPLYFLANNLTSITINGVDIPFTLDENFNNQFVSYINIGGYVGLLNSFDVVFAYGEATELQYTHSFEVKDACKYPLWNCFFKNKYGFWQSIPFNMLSKSKLEVEGSDYMPMVSNFGQYSLASHNIETYQPKGIKQITLNTDFIPELYNELFTEMMMSEKIYLENNGIYYPVNKDTQSLQIKTKVADKLIQYTMDFKFSYNIMNTVI